MNIILISDTHGFYPEVPDGDILVHAGDLTMRGTRQEVTEASEWLQSLPHKHKIVIAGNHDWLFEKEPEIAQELMLVPGVTYLENSAVMIEGLVFYGSPVQPRFYDWAFNVDRGAAIRGYWQKIPVDVDVLITHGPPRGILDQANPFRNTEHCGCDDLLIALETKRPKIHVFGHIHGGYGKKELSFGTICYNASVVDERYRVKNKPFIVEVK
jgi:Icc-related predicted phosphoesterase